MNRTVDRGTLTIAYVVLGLGALVALLPLALMLVSALKTSAEIVANPLALPQIPQWQNFLRAWKDAELGTSLLNSVKVTGLTVVLICVTGSMAAHALTRQRARGSRWISVYFLATTTLPIQLYLFPLYFGFAKLNLVDSVVATSLIYTAIYSPFSIFLLRTYFLAIPVEVEEAALMDAAKPWQVFSFITLPLVSPGVLTVAVIA
jgi:raffinose/stachyose/melibiose transport system permease protein